MVETRANKIRWCKNWMIIKKAYMHIWDIIAVVLIGKTIVSIVFIKKDERPKISYLNVNHKKPGENELTIKINLKQKQLLKMKRERKEIETDN